MMLLVFGAWNNAALFQTGWFVESLLTQTLIIHIIRTAKVPFIESRASPALITTSLIICCVGIALPFTWVGSSARLCAAPLALLATHCRHAYCLCRPDPSRKGVVCPTLGHVRRCVWSRKPFHYGRALIGMYLLTHCMKL